MFVVKIVGFFLKIGINFLYYFYPDPNFFKVRIGEKTRIRLDPDLKNWFSGLGMMSSIPGILRVMVPVLSQVQTPCRPINGLVESCVKF